MTTGGQSISSRQFIRERICRITKFWRWRAAAPPSFAKLVGTYGGEPVVAPAMREVPLESNGEALAFAKALFAGEFDMVIFLTGVGTRALLSVVETAYKREDYIAALQRVKVVARGPKPVAALRELGITPAITAPEPNTWRELLLAPR